ncbi:hypothetical protein [Rhodococcus jostii]|uniref:hypothetical protein n=1 Tax=Rhodococcus jostii TaxID=132919 RepID=UPI0036486B0B
MSAVDWDRIGIDKFERIVDTLMARKWQGIAEVICPDGRGGDGGIDIEVRQGERRRVYQLKYFPDGFSGNMKKTRTDQIRSSFKRAMKLDPAPVEWTLVVPSKLIPGEREFVEGLEQYVDEGTKPPKISILDRVELDLLLLAHPDVYAYLGREQMRSDVELYRLETATLVGGTDALTERITGLGDLADSTDLYWAVDFAREGDQVTYTARPKDPNAHIKSPITATIAGSFGSEHTAVQRQFEHALKYGASGPVVLPPEVVRQLTISGPELIAGQHSNVEVRFEPLSENPHVGELAELKFFDAEGNEAAAHEGRVTYINNGSIGLTLRIEFYEHVQVELHYPLDKSIPGDGQISYNFTRIRPADALRVIELVRSLRSPGVCKTYIDGRFMWSMEASAAAVREDSDDELDVLYGIARDLVTVQDFCNTKFAIPDEVTAIERINLRVARILIEGYVAASPEAPTGIMQLVGNDSPRIRLLLEEGGHIGFTVKDFTLRLGARELNLGDVYVFHHSAVAINGEEALKALDAGDAQGFRVKFRPGDDPYFYLAMLSRVPDPGAPMVAAWSLPDIDQPGVEDGSAA